MSDNQDANKLCVDCQLCCRGNVCRVLVKEEEKKLFPTVDFLSDALSKGRAFFNQPCPHISSQGCQIYYDRPTDCANFTCHLLKRVKSGEIPLSDALETVAELKTDVEAIMLELCQGKSDTRGFRELRKAWVADGKHLENPEISRKLWSVLKRFDKQIFPQSGLSEIRAARKQKVEKLLLETPDIVTPAFVADDITLDETVLDIKEVLGDSGAKLLFSVKANCVASVIERLAIHVDGFSCSSLPEVQLVRQIAGPSASIHFVGPGIANSDTGSLIEDCDNVSLNSLNQFDRFGASKKPEGGWGLRVNPHLSLCRDPRYDPCRANSKLGVSIYALKEKWREDPSYFNDLGGLHIHTATGVSDFGKLVTTVDLIRETVPELLHQINWINLGGGYRIQRGRNKASFRRAIRELRERFGLVVYVEPGTALVRKSCWLMATVVDLFNSEGCDVAVLDTSINHQLEGFIYDFAPSVANTSRDGAYEYQLAGATCLAGDLLGNVSFAQPLTIGSKVLFQHVGAYNHAFTIRYNGLHPPDIYQIDSEQSVILRRRFDQNDFASVCGARTRTVLE